MNKPLRIVCALVSGTVAAFVTLVTVTYAPLFVMIWRYGSKEVEDAPAHEGAVILLSFPLGCLFGLVVFALLTRFVYRSPLDCLTPPSGRRLRRACLVENPFPEKYRFRKSAGSAAPPSSTDDKPVCGGKQNSALM
jgi:hypothetical protein